jgi:beta-galactosidase
MVRLWSLEAFAHGAQTVSYFRWRQAPFAQEQMHSGLLRSDGVEAEGFQEAKNTFEDINKIEWPARTKSKIAIVFDYSSAWAWKSAMHSAN